MANAPDPNGFPKNDVGWGKARPDLEWVKDDTDK
jgi:hypothetical protein